MTNAGGGGEKSRGWGRKPDSETGLLWRVSVLGTEALSVLVRLECVCLGTAQRERRKLVRPVSMWPWQWTVLVGNWTSRRAWIMNKPVASR